MSISSAMNAGVMGLSVNSSKLASISDNIANSETIGFKRTDVEFASLVLTERTSGFDAGGVTATAVRDVRDQGALLGTRNATDIAISGQGFLPVTDIVAVERGGDLPLKLARTGSFQPDANGILRTSQGFVLLGWPADAAGNIPPQPRDSADGLVPVTLSSLDIAVERTERLDLRVNLPSAAQAGETFPLPIEVFNQLGGPGTVRFEFTKTANPDEWTLLGFDLPNGGPLPAPPPAPILDLTITFDNTPATPNPGGILSVIPNAGVYDPATGLATVTLTDGPIDIGLGPVGAATGLSQFDAEFAAIAVDKDGVPASNLVGVELGENGLLSGIFDGGFRKTLFQIPVGNVQNPNGLRAEDGQVYTITRQSGRIQFNDAGSNGAGKLVGSALEQSTVDVAAELTSLIRTQRAFSSNATIIRTVDEMLQETTNLKR